MYISSAGTQLRGPNSSPDTGSGLLQVPGRRCRVDTSSCSPDLILGEGVIVILLGCYENVYIVSTLLSSKSHRSFLKDYLRLHTQSNYDWTLFCHILLFDRSLREINRMWHIHRHITHCSQSLSREVWRKNAELPGHLLPVPENQLGEVALFVSQQAGDCLTESVYSSEYCTEPRERLKHAHRIIQIVLQIIVYSSAIVQNRNWHYSTEGILNN